MSYADRRMKHMIESILTGYSDVGMNVRPKWDDGTPAHTLSQFGIVNRYDLQKEFPITTLRRTAFKSAIDEILWIWQKKSNNTRDLNSRIWDSWADESGSIGAAYGHQLAIKHQYVEGEFDQVDRVLYDLKHNSSSRRIITDIYVHQDLHKMNLYPCVHHTQWIVKDGKLNLLLKQRSSDLLVANNWNVVQYAVLQHMFAQVSGLEVGELVHVIGDCHIYDRHIEGAKEMLKRKPLHAPRFKMNKEITNFYDFTVDDFELEGYETHEQLRFEVAI